MAERLNATDGGVALLPFAEFVSVQNRLRSLSSGRALDDVRRRYRDRLIELRGVVGCRLGDKRCRDSQGAWIKE